MRTCSLHGRNTNEETNDCELNCRGCESGRQQTCRRSTENRAYYRYVFLEVLSTTSGYFYKKKSKTKQKNFKAFKFSAY